MSIRLLYGDKTRNIYAKSSIAKLAMRSFLSFENKPIRSKQAGIIIIYLLPLLNSAALFCQLVCDHKAYYRLLK